MRRAEKEITDLSTIELIIKNALVCRLALSKDNSPYMIPISFGYDGKNIFFHTAKEGMKLDFIKDNDSVCFEMEHDIKLVKNESSPCNWTFSFYSVIGFGKIEEIFDSETKKYALNQIMIHYSGREWSFPDLSFEKIRVWRILIDKITGKQSKDKIIN